MPDCKWPLPGLFCEFWMLPGSQRLRKLSLLSPVAFLHQTLHLLFYFYKSIFMLLGCKAHLTVCTFAWLSISGHPYLPSQLLLSSVDGELLRLMLVEGEVRGFQHAAMVVVGVLLNRQQGGCIYLLLWLFHSCSPAEAYWVGDLTCHCCRGGPPHTGCLAVMLTPLSVSILLLECPSLDMGSRLGRLSWGCAWIWLGLSGPLDLLLHQGM